jgi:hypothetical protein
MHKRVLAELLDLMDESIRQPSITGQQDRWRAVYRSSRLWFAAAAVVILCGSLISYHIFQTIRPSTPVKPISDAPDHVSSENRAYRREGTLELKMGRGFRQLRAAATVVRARIIRISGIVSEDVPGDIKWDVDVIRVLHGSLSENKSLSENRSESRNRISIQVPYPLSLSVANIRTGTEVILFLGIGNEGLYELISIGTATVEGEGSSSDLDNSKDSKAVKDASSGEEK